MWFANWVDASPRSRPSRTSIIRLETRDDPLLLGAGHVQNAWRSDLSFHGRVNSALASFTSVVNALVALLIPIGTALILGVYDGFVGFVAGAFFGTLIAGAVCGGLAILLDIRNTLRDAAGAAVVGFASEERGAEPRPDKLQDVTPDPPSMLATRKAAPQGGGSWDLHWGDRLVIVLCVLLVLFLIFMALVSG